MKVLKGLAKLCVFMGAVILVFGFFGVFVHFPAEVQESAPNKLSTQAETKKRH